MRISNFWTPPHGDENHRVAPFCCPRQIKRRTCGSSLGFQWLRSMSWLKRNATKITEYLIARLLHPAALRIKSMNFDAKVPVGILSGGVSSLALSFFKGATAIPPLRSRCSRSTVAAPLNYWVPAAFVSIACRLCCLESVSAKHNSVLPKISVNWDTTRELRLISNLL